MAKKGQSRHMKRYAAPRALKLPRKSFPWMVKPSPGPHPRKSSLPLRLLLRDYLSLARTAREADRILAGGQVLVDGRVRRSPKFSVGLMDVVQLLTLNQNYRVLLDHRGRLVLHEIDKAETSLKLCKVMRKDIVRGRRVQLSFHDGKALVGDFDEFRPGDGVKLALPELKVLERFPFEKGVTVLVTGGKNVSKVGTITDVKLVEGKRPNIVTFEAAGETFQAPEHYVFVVGKEKPAISLQEASA